MDEKKSESLLLDPTELSGISAAFDILPSFDDKALIDTLALDDEQLFPADWGKETTPYEENLYSTPLNWDPPETKFEPHLPIATASAAAVPYSSMNILTPAQQERLRNIAMPHHLQYKQNQRSPQSSGSTKSHSSSSPDNHHDNEANHSRKRKSSAEVGSDEDDDLNAPVKKTAHNMIEKRYRTNLNDKIAALRDSVPSLRIMSKSARGEDTADDREELQGLTPAHKLNKATVLSKATEYINHLEKRNKRLQAENAEQKARIAAFETLFRCGSMGFNPAPQMNNIFQYPQDYNTPGPSPIVDPQGMIQVPEDMRRLHNQVNQQAYPVPQEQYPQAQQMNGWANNGGYFGKLMVGSLAGLMIMEGFSEREQEGESPSARGLLAVPTQIVGIISRALHASLEVNAFGYHFSASQSLAYLKLFFVLGALVYVFLPKLFSSLQEPKSNKARGTSLAAAPSLASSIQVRRQAWLTAIQTVWVPRHNFFLEAAALLLKTAKLSLRNVVGPHGYAYLTGITEQQEAARVKAWSIALDAQLAGGDVEVSKSRLTLTLLASGTLPDTPARLMLKALHIRVLLWEVGNSGFNGFFLFQEIAAKLARSKWNEAKQLRRMIAYSKVQQDDELPPHLAALLDQECDDVLVDCIGQRAYNLAWNLPTTHNTDESDDGMDYVVDDFAIRSPLDAVAGWYSSLVLRRALAKSLESSEDDISAQNSIAEDIALAIRTAPNSSGAQIRALVARAVLIKEKRGTSIAAAVQALGPVEKESNKTPNLINTRASIADLPGVKMSLRCAMAIAHIDRFPPPGNPQVAHRIISTVTPVNMTLLGFTAAYFLMERINSHQLVTISCISSLERLAGGLRIWVGGKEGGKCGLGKETKTRLVERCLGITKKVVGMEDAGYESMSDGEGC